MCKDFVKHLVFRAGAFATQWSVCAAVFVNCKTNSEMFVRPPQNLVAQLLCQWELPSPGPLSPVGNSEPAKEDYQFIVSSYGSVGESNVPSNLNFGKLHLFSVRTKSPCSNFPHLIKESFNVTTFLESIKTTDASIHDTLIFSVETSTKPPFRSQLFVSSLYGESHAILLSTDEGWTLADLVVKKSFGKTIEISFTKIYQPLTPVPFINQPQESRETVYYTPERTGKIGNKIGGSLSTTKASIEEQISSESEIVASGMRSKDSFYGQKNPRYDKVELPLDSGFQVIELLKSKNQSNTNDVEHVLVAAHNSSLEKIVFYEFHKRSDRSTWTKFEIAAFENQPYWQNKKKIKASIQSVKPRTQGIEDSWFVFSSNFSDDLIFTQINMSQSLQKNTAPNLYKINLNDVLNKTTARNSNRSTGELLKKSFGVSGSVFFEDSGSDRMRGLISLSGQDKIMLVNFQLPDSKSSLQVLEPDAGLVPSG